MVAHLNSADQSTSTTNVGAAGALDLSGARRIVVKIGSALLVDEKSGKIRQAWLQALADDIAALRAGGAEVLIVSSGSIAVGRTHLALKRGALRLEEKQAAAATGQIQLAHAYQDALARHGFTVAQILLTPSDTEVRRRHLNARGTILQLLKLGAIPVINENDTVATEEIRYGDNDRLAARVATMVSADLLVLLSDIDGLYTADPRKNPTARHLPVVEGISPKVEAMAGKAPVGFSSGGMVTKLEAGKIALGGGCRMVIAKGVEPHGLMALAHGSQASWFLPSVEPLAARKRWIAGTLEPVGSISVDAGASAALSRGKSLLPAGAVSLSGDFQRGDPVRVLGPDGSVIGTGISAYAADDATRILGKKTGEIEGILGYKGRSELIHADDLAFDRRPGSSDRNGQGNE